MRYAQLPTGTTHYIEDLSDKAAYLTVNFLHGNYSFRLDIEAICTLSACRVHYTLKVNRAYLKLLSQALESSVAGLNIRSLKEI